MSRFFVTVLFFLSFSFGIKAGWVIVEHTLEPNGEVYESVLYIQDGKVKSVDEERILIFDLDKWILTLISPVHGGYWIGRPSDYLVYNQKYALEYLKREIELADEFDRPVLEAIYDDLKMDLERSDDVVSFVGELPLEIIMTDETKRIMGYMANKFVVYVDRIRTEEIWLTRGISLTGDYDFEKFRAFIDEMSWGGMFQDYRSSEQYIHLMKSGFPLITIEEDDNGTESVTEVKNIEKQHIPESAFRPPPDYKPMDISEISVVFNW